MVVTAILLETIAVICADRYAVKQHRRALENRNEHLTDVTDFLKTVIPGTDLFNPDQVGELINRLTGIVEENRPFAMEPLNKSSAAADGSFDPTFQFENREIHKAFLRFPNFNLGQNLSPSALADLIRASLDLVEV